MVKVFDLYAIFHVLDNWDNLKPKLDTRIKSGQKVALEVSPANLSKVSPFIELCLKHDVAKNLSPKETVLLKELREKWSGKQNTSFLIELIYYLRKEGCEVIPIGSSFGDKLAAKKVMQLAEMERTDAHYGSTPDRLRKRKELFDQLEAIQVLREERHHLSWSQG